MSGSALIVASYHASSAVETVDTASVKRLKVSAADAAHRELGRFG